LVSSVFLQETIPTIKIAIKYVNFLFIVISWRVY
jgi:hypothetical protein